MTHTSEKNRIVTHQEKSKNKQVHQYDTRQKNDLHPVKINTRLYGEKTISFQGRDYWNKLPNSLKEVTSVAVFKRKLKQHILDNY